jgi:type I restriction enzyme R subunit
MQAIARVNRVFRDKPAGLIVDYIGIAQNLKSALAAVFASATRKGTGSTRPRPSPCCWRSTIVRDMFHGFDYATALTGTPHTTAGDDGRGHRVDSRQAAAMGCPARNGQGRQEERAPALSGCVLALSKAFALASASDEARDPRGSRLLPGHPRRAGQVSRRLRRDLAGARFAIQQIVSRAWSRPRSWTS